MARGRLAFRERDVRRALRAVAKAGHPVQRVEIMTDGRISVVIGQPANDNAPAPGANEWDQP